VKDRENSGDAPEVKPGRGDGSPGQDLVENLPPGPDTEVIKKSSREDNERSWFLGVFLALLALTLIADLAGGAWLSSHAWAQVKPEIASDRTFLFQVAGVIIGFYFGSTVRRARSLCRSVGRSWSEPEQSYDCSGVLPTRVRAMRSRRPARIEVHAVAAGAVAALGHLPVGGSSRVRRSPGRTLHRRRTRPCGPGRGI
jgi:hypothetical protein